jgi:hypothetical protein
MRPDQTELLRTLSKNLYTLGGILDTAVNHNRPELIFTTLAGVGSTYRTLANLSEEQEIRDCKEDVDLHKFLAGFSIAKVAGWLCMGCHSHHKGAMKPKGCINCQSTHFSPCLYVIDPTEKKETV